MGTSPSQSVLSCRKPVVPMGSGWYHLMPVADYRRSHLTLNPQQKGRPMTQQESTLRKLLSNAGRMERLAVVNGNPGKVRAARILARHLRRNLKAVA